MKEGRPSWTARWVATQRARLHDSRPSRGDAAGELRLYKDLVIPFLGIRLAGPTGMGTRTRFVDDQLVQAVDHGVGQVGIIGSGYDGRSLRFSEMPVQWIEVDHPATQADKRARLARIGITPGNVAFVGVDLTDCDLDTELARAGHDPAQPSLWICEGLFPYLARPDINVLCCRLRARSSPGSLLVCNVLVNDHPTLLTRVVRGGVDRLLAAIGESRLSDFRPDEVEGLLAAAGWQTDIRESTKSARTDGTYLLAVTALPA